MNSRELVQIKSDSHQDIARNQAYWTFFFFECRGGREIFPQFISKNGNGCLQWWWKADRVSKKGVADEIIQRAKSAKFPPINSKAGSRRDWKLLQSCSQRLQLVPKLLMLLFNLAAAYINNSSYENKLIELRQLLNLILVQPQEIKKRVISPIHHLVITRKNWTKAKPSELKPCFSLMEHTNQQSWYLKTKSMNIRIKIWIPDHFVENKRLKMLKKHIE